MSFKGEYIEIMRNLLGDIYQANCLVSAVAMIISVRNI